MTLVRKLLTQLHTHRHTAHQMGACATVMTTIYLESDPDDTVKAKQLKLAALEAQAKADALETEAQLMLEVAQSAESKGLSRGRQLFQNRKAAEAEGLAKQAADVAAKAMAAAEEATRKQMKSVTTANVPLSNFLALNAKKIYTEVECSAFSRKGQNSRAFGFLRNFERALP